jgi:hypothetical protein
LLFGDEAGCLSKDGPAGAGVEFWVGGYRERLRAAVRQFPPQFHVAATLRVDRETKADKD